MKNVRFGFIALIVVVGTIGIFMTMVKEKEKPSVALNIVNEIKVVEYFGAPGPGPSPSPKEGASHE